LFDVLFSFHSVITSQLSYHLRKGSHSLTVKERKFSQSVNRIAVSAKIVKMFSMGIHGRR
jgi:hypothetical protein